MLKNFLFINVIFIVSLMENLHAQQLPQLKDTNKNIEALVEERYPRPSLMNRFARRHFWPKVIAHFDWSMPERYGLDLNRNGIIDLPNSVEYVENQIEWHNTSGCSPLKKDSGEKEIPRFRVILDFKRTMMPILRKHDRVDPTENPNPTDERGSPRDTQPLIDTTLMVEQFRRGQQYLEWSIEGTNLDAPIVKTTPFNTDRKILEECLPEGTYNITLTARDDWTGDLHSMSKNITVNDILIVQIGDSFASGNGVPEWRAKSAISEIHGLEPEQYDLAYALAEMRLRQNHDQDFITSIWADTGERFQTRAPVSKTINTGLVGLPDFNVTLTQDAKLPEYSMMSKMHKEHYLSHRSSYSSGSQAAIALERASTKTSVTFVNLAMVGATVNDGILGGYKGINSERFYSNNTMKSQLDQLQAIIGNREIDALLISIGGNDAGFANALEGLIVRDRGGSISPGIGPTYSEIETGVHNGTWAAVKNKISDLFCLIRCKLEWDTLQGLDSLSGEDGKYDEIRQRISNLNIPVRNIYITEYPDFSRNSEAETCGQVLNTIFPDSVPGGLEIKKEELEWARSHILAPLNNAVNQGARLNDWTFVDGIFNGSRNHGLCAPRPYNPLDFNINVRHVPIVLPASCRQPLGLSEGGAITPSCNDVWEHGVCTPNPVRWYRNEKEGEVIENLPREINTQMAHPNEYGNALVSESILLKICPELK